MEENRIFYVIQQVVDLHETEDVDFWIQDQLGFNENKHDYTQYISKGKDPVLSACPINIDDLFKKLLEYKGKGVTHVSIEYHPDHITYILEALKMKPATEQEIEEYRQQAVGYQKEVVESKIKELEEKLDTLKKARSEWEKTEDS
jgi:hypothetical protein